LSARRFWDQVVRGGCTLVHYLGGILDILMRLPRESQPATHSLRVAWGAGVSASAWVATRERLRIALRECYGMTEGSSFATVNQTDKPGSIGKALPWLTVELLDDNDRPVPMGELGQIVVSSKIEGNLLPGYLNDTRARAQALRNGKLYTGDMARVDSDGDFYFVGRQTESMRVRGENVSAWEIERVILDYPDVAAVAAVGVQSEIGEQEILLYVKWRENAAPSFVRLSAWAQSRLAEFQWPRYYLSVDQFDLTPSERVRKHLLSCDVKGAWDRLRA
jgi:crotonobetaine/carnitine-CoA ligase